MNGRGTLVERFWQMEAEVLGEKNLSQYEFAHNEFHMNWPRVEPGTPLWEVGD